MNVHFSTSVIIIYVIAIFSPIITAWFQVPNKRLTNAFIACAVFCCTITICCMIGPITGDMRIDPLAYSGALTFIAKWTPYGQLADAIFHFPSPLLLFKGPEAIPLIEKSIHEQDTDPDMITLPKVISYLSAEQTPSTQENICSVQSSQEEEETLPD